MTMTLNRPAQPSPFEATPSRQFAELRNVTVELDGRTILNNVDLTINQGECLGIIGGNGSGKSTILKLLTGLLRPDIGEVAVFGKTPSSPDVLHRIGAAIDTPALYPWMSGKAVLRTVLDLKGSPNRDQAITALDQFGLGDAGRKPVVKYSQGMRKRLALAVASLDNPDLVLLDEPTNALDPQARQIVDTWLDSLREAGVTTVIVTHRFSEAERCDRLVRITPEATLVPATPEDLHADD